MINKKYIIDSAKYIATKAHEGFDKGRKYCGISNICSHSEEVVQLVRSVTNTDEVIAAAWLHDMIEIQLANSQMAALHKSLRAPFLDATFIAKKFGYDVASLVCHVTDVSRPEDGSRKARRVIDLKHAEVASPEAKTIKIADLISHVKRAVHLNSTFAKEYLSSKGVLLNVLEGGDPVLWKQADELIGGLLSQIESDRLFSFARNKPKG